MEKDNKNHWWIIWLIICINSLLPIINPYYSWWQQRSTCLRMNPVGRAVFQALLHLLQPTSQPKLSHDPKAMIENICRTWPAFLSNYCCHTHPPPSAPLLLTPPISANQYQKGQPKSLRAISGNLFHISVFPHFYKMEIIISTSYSLINITQKHPCQVPGT